MKCWGEMRLQGGGAGRDTLRSVKFILEARGNTEASEKETRGLHLDFRTLGSGMENE